MDQLYFLLNGKIIESAKFSNFKVPIEFDDFELNFPLKINKVWNKGKLIIFEFSKIDSNKTTFWMLNSLRMTGKWLINISKEKKSHIKFQFEFKEKEDNGIFDIKNITYLDVRGFGTFEFFDNVIDVYEKINKIERSFLIGGLSPENIKIITEEYFIDKVKNCKGILLTKLMDQKSICSGIGNYLISEIFYKSRLYSKIKCDELTTIEIKTLYNNIKNIILKSYECGGLSMKDYTDVFGIKGKYEKHLKVYGMKNKKDKNGYNIIGDKINGRTFWFVPFLQQKK